jgi:hypothetical protein
MLTIIAEGSFGLAGHVARRKLTSQQSAPSSISMSWLLTRFRHQLLGASGRSIPRRFHNSVELQTNAGK